MSLLQFKDADLGYPGKRVLRAVNVQISAGDFLLVAGANGSGKSTLLRTLIGALPLVAGTMLSPADLRIGYVPQQMSLPAFFPVTVLDVVAMGTWRRAKSKEHPKRADAAAALDLIGLGARAHQSFAQLSGGQRQRALLARALVSHPNLLILDEPISGVDEAAAAVILQVLAERVQAGVAVVMVTHQPLALADVASRSVLVHDQRVEEIPVLEMCSLEGVARLWA